MPASPVNKRIYEQKAKKQQKSLKNVLTNYIQDDIITKSSVRYSKQRQRKHRICGIWRGTEVVITGRS